MNDYSDTVKRPFVRMVKPEWFVSFKVSSDDGYPKISQFIFVEEIEVNDPDDEFDSLLKNQYTVLDLSENPNNAGKKNYRVRVYQSVKTKENAADTSEKMILISEKFPKKNSEFFDDIPLTIHGVENINFTVKKSLLSDISDMNISVIQRTVDQVYMLHWTALPTPWVSGAEDKDSVTTIGPSKVWHLENPEAKVGMLEFTGNSSRAHQDFIDNLLYLMSVMGAQILKKEGVSRETATSVLVRTAQQTSLVATMVKNVSGQLQTVYTHQFEWAGATITSELNYKLNDDFVKADMEPNAQIALVKSWLDGAVSHETIFDKMKEGEIVNNNLTFEDEKARIKANPPPFFSKEIDAENAKATAEASFQNEADVRKDMAESNLQNPNMPNKQATQQV